MPNAPKYAAHALRDHLWTAWDVASQASWRGTPRLVDLLAGGRRQGFNESPDSFYSLGFINIRSGTTWRIGIPDIGAFYTVVSLHSGSRQKCVEWLVDENDRGERSILLCHEAPAEFGIDTEGFGGLCQIMVRQYFTYPVDTRRLPFPRLIQQNNAGQQKQLHWLPGWAVAGTRFLIWRLKPLLAVKYLHYRLGNRLPRNVFLSFEDIVQLWKGGAEMVTRMGIERFRYLFCYYDLTPGQAMKIRYDANNSRYFAFALNHLWVQRLIHNVIATHANSYQLESVNGCYEVMITLQPVDQKNNLCTLGNRRGIIAFREILPGLKPTLPECTIVTGRY